MPALMSNSSSSGSRLHTPSPSPSSGMSNMTSGLVPPSSSASTYSLPLRPHGMRAHLAELFHRHAIFAVKLTVHQLWNVPLVSGEFGVKWKFQRVHRVKRPGSANANANGSGILGMTGMSGDNIDGRMMRMVTPGSAGSLNGLQNVKGKGREVVDADHDSLTPSGASMLSIPSTSEDSSSPSSSTSPRATSVDLPSTDSHQGTKDGEGRGMTGNMEEFSQEARGRTHFAPLRDHHVKWGETVKVAVQMGIQRDTLDLQPCELKLVIEQLREPGGPDAPTNSRLGVVYLNLAEYVDEGPVTRRYLLRQSKVNATLQLTLELTHIGGSDKFKAPPLRKGEVMAGVATLLEKSRRRAGAGMGGPLLVAPGYERTNSRPTIRSHRRATDGGSRSNVALGADPEGSGMGSRLHMHTPIPELGIRGLRTTDNIIEAIFNPVPTSSPAPSPFTYYVPTKARSGVAPTPTPLMNINTADRGLMASDAGESLSPGPRCALSRDADVSAGVEEDGDLERAPSIARSYSAQSEHSFATSASRSSAVSGSGSGSGSGSYVGETHRHKWWKKITGMASRSSSPRPSSPAPLPLSASASAQPPPSSAQLGASFTPSVCVSQSELEREHDDDGEELEVRLRDRKYGETAPQIVVRSPTRKSKTAPAAVMSSSEGWEHGQGL